MKVRCSIQKKPRRSVVLKCCSTKMQQIYRRALAQKCDFNNVANQFYWNLTFAWVFSCKFAKYFENAFLEEHCWESAFVHEIKFFKTLVNHSNLPILLAKPLKKLRSSSFLDHCMSLIYYLKFTLFLPLNSRKYINRKTHSTNEHANIRTMKTEQQKQQIREVLEINFLEV